MSSCAPIAATSSFVLSLVALASLVGCDGAIAPGDAGVAIVDAEDGGGEGEDGAAAPIVGGADAGEPASAVCAPSCAARVCGDDGCGGSCGACDERLACVAEGAACGCDGALTYRFAAPEVDWTQTERLIVAYRQVFARSADARAPWTRWATVELSDAHRRREITVEGACAPDLEIVRVFVTAARDALGRALVCESDVERVQTTEVVLPPGTGRVCAM